LRPRQSALTDISPGNLRKLAFTRELLSLAQAFECGEEEWETEVADWIKAPQEGAADAVEENDCAVWLYRTPDRELVGYASLGLSHNPWNIPGYGRARIAIIPFLGVSTQFQGQPKGVDRLDRFAAQIMRDLIAEALHLDGRGLPILGLMVDYRNEKAINFYERLGFVALDARDGSRRYVRMIVRLPATIEPEQAESSSDPR